jgi:hypothetical protein
MGVQLHQEIGLARRALLLLESLEPLLDQLEVREDHLGLEIDHLTQRLSRRAGGRIDMGPRHLAQRFHLAHRREHGTIEAAGGTAAAGLCGDVAEGDLRERLLPGLKQLGQSLDARVRHLDHPQVGLAACGAEPGFGRKSGQCVEYRGLP